ncbi:MAG: 4-alpha-glucanotransferase [Clostridiales bacterium]|jgi:4-alpha-glucanotransferase|nr:4-alpha-glucanotransferase [Clostridiales bacterium]
MKNLKQSGVLLNISSLPNDFSIGSLGLEAYEFVDLIASLGFDYWQMLPINPVDFANSPYDSPMPFGGNLLFLDLVELYNSEVITKAELESQRIENKNYVDYSFKELRVDMINKAFARYIGTDDEAIVTQAVQNEFWRQWFKLKVYANDKGIRLIGDLPFYVSADSDQVKMYPEFFDLTTQGGAPPDYFCPDGQAWGSPTYNWKATGIFTWWAKRLEIALRAFDKVRIDHFRGLVEYWCLPSDAKDGVKGEWREGEPIKWFDSMKEKVDVSNLIAEDLGVIDDKVQMFLDVTGIPGMRVMQFGLDKIDYTSQHLPHNYPKNCLAYTGTHDNDTSWGFLSGLEGSARVQFLRYCGMEGDLNREDDDFRRLALHAMYRELFRSRAKIAILPMQDILMYGSDARMNTPGEVGGWVFRLSDNYASKVDREYYKQLNYFRKFVW